jgi:hypothetical protein
MHQNEQFSKPFFAKFLESQQAAKETTADNQRAQPWPIITIPIGDMDHTMKYPSDNDEDIYI